MDPYFPIILTQNILLCLGISYYIHRSCILKKYERTGFYLTLYFGLLITVGEFISTLIIGKPHLIGLQYLVNCMIIGLTPMVPAVPVLVLGKVRWAKVVVMIPILLNLLLLLTGHLFTISSDGGYSRDPLFWVFMMNYVFNMLFLTYRSFVFSAIHQNHNAVSLIFICLFMISSTSIQLRLPQIHFSWFCVTVTTLLYFIYYVDTIHKMDSLTGLLNRNAFREYTVRCRRRIAGIMVIDMDDFKKINDTYGHLTGDKYLIVFGKCLRSAMKNWGFCYRLGGDEFCILLLKSAAAPAPEALARILREKCREQMQLPEILSFSYGYQALEEAMSIEEAFNLSDRDMYAAKSRRKEKASI